MTSGAQRGVLFGEVRADALAALERGKYTAWRNPRPCVWQNYAPSRHSALYCNVLSHLDSLEDLLREGCWCDDAVIAPKFSEAEDCVRLFRYYGLAFLVFEECIADLRLIRGAANGRAGTSKATVEHEAERYVAFINHVWKHRNTEGPAGAFHRIHHHGPYLYADCPGYEAALPTDGAYVALGHQTPSHHAPPVPLVVPSLTSAMKALSATLLATSSLLQEREARSRVDARYGTARL